MAKDLIVLDPFPRTVEGVFDAQQFARLEGLGEIVRIDSRNDPASLDGVIDRAAAIIGQPDLSQERLKRAVKLRTVINVEGNFFPNVDYDTCFQSGVSVLSIAPAFAYPVAEMALGLALDLARGITAADASVRAGGEVYGSRGNAHARLISRSTVGIIGFGSIGRTIRKLLAGFSVRVLVHDPWLPAGAIREEGCEPVALEELLSRCDTVFVSAAVTSENQHLLDRPTLELMRPDAALVLVGRAGIADFDVLLDMAEKGRLRIATDVFPAEPIAADDPIRRSKILLSPHRAGGMRAALFTAAEMIIDDLSLILAGLPPVRLLQARRETVGKMRSKPASYR